MVIDMEMRKRRLYRLAELTGPSRDPVGVLLLLDGGAARSHLDWSLLDTLLPGAPARKR